MIKEKNNYKKTQKTTTKNKITYLEGKLFKAHGLHLKFIGPRG